MSTVALVALARPTFDLACAQANFDSARALLNELGATVVGPAELVMTVEDVAAVLCRKPISIFSLWLHSLMHLLQ